MIDSKSANPYDCQNPVVNPRMFAGRSSELSEVRYYLSQALVARPTNLAFIGTRGSGKTSLLNMASHHAHELGLAAVDVRFDESHATSQLSFFFHMFDCIVNAVIDMPRVDGSGPCFGGRGGPLYRAYIDAAYAFERVDPVELGFLFPLSYAAIMSKSRTDSVLPQAQFSDDLKRIAQEVGRPIVLLLDECNVVVSRRDVLQALRNVFQTQARYMLILAGTEQLFPAIDEVFSPVGRGFKQIAVDRYSGEAETLDCMRMPLIAAGLSTSPIRAFEPEAPEDLAAIRQRSGSEMVVTPQLRDLHQFTAGSPLEIRRACHFMFRDMQLRGARSMRMSAAVLDAVLQDLASSSDRQELLRRIRSLSTSAMMVASVLSRYARELDCQNVHELAVLESALGGRQAPSLRDVQEGVQELARLEFVVFNTGSGVVSWVAGDLENVMAKYVIRAAGRLAGRFPDRPAISHELSSVARSTLFARLSSFERLPQEGGWLPWFRPWPTGVPQILEVEDCDLGCFGLHAAIRFNLVDHNTGEKSGVCWYGRLNEHDRISIAELVASLEREVASINEVVLEHSSRFVVEVHHRVHELVPALTTSVCHAREVCSRIKNRNSMVWSKFACMYLCAEFLEKGLSEALVAAVDEMSAHDESVTRPSELEPNLGFLALASGLPVARSYLVRLLGATDVRGVRELMRYNAALSCLTSTPPDLRTAATELQALASDGDFASADRGGYRALVAVRQADDGDLELYLWRQSDSVPGEPETCPRLQDFVVRALDVIRSTEARGGLPVIRRTIAVRQANCQSERSINELSPPAH